MNKYSGQRNTGKYVDGKKLKRILERRGMTMAEASLEIGKSNKCLDNSLRLGRLGNDTIKKLENVLGIKPERYVIQEQAPEDADDDRLRDIEAILDKYSQRIIEGVFDAIVRANDLLWNGDN